MSSRADDDSKKRPIDPFDSNDKADTDKRPRIDERHQGDAATMTDSSTSTTLTASTSTPHPTPANPPTPTSTVSWGEWMGAHKTTLDAESERIDRQKAALGGDAVARLKDLHILLLGLRGVGVETAKNVILSNVGSVTIWDVPGEAGRCQEVDRGSNFYVTAEDVVQGRRRVDACLGELKSLNPFCRVDELSSTSSSGASTAGYGVIADPADGHQGGAAEEGDEEDQTNLLLSALQSKNVAGSNRGYSAVVVTVPLPRTLLYRLNAAARQNGVAFILAWNAGVTASIFSDFGSDHEIHDESGEPTNTLAVSNLEVLSEKPELLDVHGYGKSGEGESGSKSKERVVLATVAQSEHGLDDDDVVSLDDLRGALAGLNGRRVKVKRVAIQSPADAKVDTGGVAFKEALKLPTSAVVTNFDRQYQHYKAKFDSDPANKDKKFRVRTITLFNRLALVLSDDDLAQAGVSIDDLASYQSGGLLNQVRPPVTKSYRSLEETLESTPVPQMLRGEEWEAGVGVDVHLSIDAVLEFYEKEGRWPGIHSDSDANAVVQHAKSISDARRDKEGTTWTQQIAFGFPSGEARDLDERRVKRFARLFQTELTGFCAYLGGAAAQEILKKSGKFTPINQWIHHDEPCLVADECPSNVGPLFGSRYDHQMAVMGKDFQVRAAEQRVFLVGCGALGCEYLKGLALMGVGTGRDGKIVVTDMDRIEVSNLSRQFLFRQHDVGQPKSVSGARIVKGWNPRLNITSLERSVGNDSEDFFDDSFWESLDVCWNALDNVQARQYTDERCLFYSKPLLESGTLGTKCNHEVILPYRTSTYNDGNENDENENQIAMCTLRSFPYLPKHCIEFAKQSYFSDYFEFGPDEYETFRKDPVGYFEQVDTMEPGEQSRSLRMIKFFVDLQAGGTIDFASCVRVAFDRMMEDFRTSILNLCHSADEMEKSSGKKFWTGTKRRPRPVDWTDPIPELMEYLYCTSNMYAAVWNIDGIRDRAEFEAFITKLDLKQPEWTPSSENVDLSEGDDEGAGDGGADVDKLKGDMYSVDASNLQPACPQEFEKDDDCNFHIDFLTVSTNLRSWNYDIKASPRHTVKVTAGRIIPALATTTAMVCGLVDIEFCKLVLGLQSQGREKFLNSNINLAAGSGNFTTFCPDPPIPISTGLKAPQPESFTSWDKIEIARGSDELTVEQLVDFVERSFEVTVDRIFQHGDKDDKALYNAVDKKKLDWDIAVDEQGKVDVSDGVFSQWPQLRMAVQMLGRLPPASGQRKVFLGQVENVKKALDQTKQSFTSIFQGPVSAAYRSTYRPEEEGEKQQYFDAVFTARDYVTLGVHCHTSEEEDIILPCIKYTFA